MTRTTGALCAAALLLCVVLANWATAHYAPWTWWWLVVPAGTWFIGAVFVLRDAVQLAYSRRVAYGVLAAALGVNLLMSVRNDDLAWITAASAAAFALSGVLDTETFTRYRSSVVRRVLAAGVASGLLDSTVFVVLGLSPLTTGIVTWDQVPRAIASQVLVKTLVVAVGSTAFYRQRLVSSAS